MDLIKKLSSIKLSIFLLTAITLVCILGACLEYQFAFKYIFSSIFFWALLIAFSINLLSCSYLSFQKKVWFNSSFLIHISILIILFGGLIGKGWGIKGNLLVYEKEGTSFFFEEAHLKTFFRQFDMNGDWVWDKKEIDSWQKWQKSLSEQSEWSLFSYDSNKDSLISFQEWFQSILDAPEEIQKKMGSLLPFKLYLDEFITERYPKSPKLFITVRNTRIQEHLNVVSDTLYKIPWSSYKIKIEPWESKEIRTDEIAVSVYYGEDKKTAILSLVKNPEQIFFEDIYIHYYLEEEGQVQEWKSEIEILENNVIAKKSTISVNRPLRYKNFSFYQSSYYIDPIKKKTRSDLMVVKDHGVPFVYFGFLLLSLGLLFKFCIRPCLSSKKEAKDKS